MVTPLQMAPRTSAGGYACQAGRPPIADARLGLARSYGPPSLFLADVLVPDLRVLGDELAHQLDALGRVEVHDLHASRPQELLAADKRAVLAHHHPRNPVQEDGPGAHVARGER